MEDFFQRGVRKFLKMEKEILVESFEGIFD